MNKGEHLNYKFIFFSFVLFFPFRYSRVTTTNQHRPNICCVLFFLQTFFLDIFLFYTQWTHEKKTPIGWQRLTYTRASTIINLLNEGGWAEPYNIMYNVQFMYIVYKIARTYKSVTTSNWHDVGCCCFRRHHNRYYCCLPPYSIFRCCFFYFVFWML